MKNFFNMIYRLKVVKRWGTSANMYEESVAEHCYFVAILAYILAKLDEKLNGVKIEIDKVLIKGLYHDAFESYTSHIVSPIKNHNENIKNAIISLKEDYKERLIRVITRKVLRYCRRYTKRR